MTNNAGPAIAYLEDDPEVAKLYAGWMRDAGYPVECFVDGEEYLKAFSQKKYLACGLHPAPSAETCLPRCLWLVESRIDQS